MAEQLEVLFSGIPSDWEEEDFLIYIESSKMGGGAVQAHTFDKENHTSLVTFEDTEGLKLLV
jgi:hypothetical protein